MTRNRRIVAAGALSGVSILMCLSLACQPEETKVPPPIFSPVSLPIADHGTIGSAISYKLDYFNSAELAQKQIKDDTVPNVLSDHGKFLVLDLAEWPEGWELGNIVAVRMPNGVVEYRRLLVRFELSDGQLAIGAVEASLLEVIYSGEMTIDGDLKQTLRKGAGQTAKIVDVIDFDDDYTFRIIDETDVDLFAYSGDEVEVHLGFPEISLKATPRVTVRLIIDKPFGLSDVFGWLAGAWAAVADGVSNFLDDAGVAIRHDGNGSVVVDAAADEAEDTVNGLLAVTEIAEKVEAVASAIGNRERIKEGVVVVDGEIAGRVLFSARASAEYKPSPKERELATVLVPIAGPIPIFLQFDLVGVASMAFEGQVQATTGAEITIPFHAGFHLIDGEAQDLDRPDHRPTFDFVEPSFEGTQAKLELAAGVQCEAGITLAKIISATVDPTAEVVFDTAGAIDGDVASGCFELDWDVYARLRAELEAELAIPFVNTWEFRWDVPLTYTLLQDQWPKGDWRTCWGDLFAEAGPDKTIDVSGGSVVLEGSASGGDRSYSYQWSPPTGLSATGVAQPTASPGETTTYTLTVTDGTGATASDTVTVTVELGPPIDDSTLVSASGTFTTTSGEFEIAISPVDGDGNFIGMGLPEEAFSFRNVVLEPEAGGDPIAVTTTVTGIEAREPSEGEAVTAVLIFDSSGSMGSNDPGAEGRRNAGQAFFDTLSGDDEVAVLDFGAGTTEGLSNSRLLQDFTGDRGLLDASLNGLTESGGTPLYESVLDGLGLLSDRVGKGGVLIVLTDGEAYPTNLNKAIAQANDQEVPVFPVGLGTSVDFSNLTELARQTGGGFAQASDAAALTATFEGIAAGVTAGRVIVFGRGTYEEAAAGRYSVRGEVVAASGGDSIATAFSFVADVTDASLPSPRRRTHSGAVPCCPGEGGDKEEFER